MKNWKNRIGFLIVCILAVFLCSCKTTSKIDNTEIEGNHVGNHVENDMNESYFEWEDNYIVDLTQQGKKQSNIIIPAKCEGFSGVIFKDSKVEKISFEDDDNVNLDLAFMGAESLVEIELPENLTMIGEMCFQMCSQLKSISIPQKVESIGGYAFSGCVGLETVLFEGNHLEIIAENCFEYCSAMKEIVIPEGVKIIEEYAFFECELLDQIVLPSSLNTIKKLAFNKTALTELHLPKEIILENVDKDAFGMNTYDMTIYVEEKSWCDENRDQWNVGFKEVKLEE